MQKMFPFSILLAIYFVQDGNFPLASKWIYSTRKQNCILADSRVSTWKIFDLGLWSKELFTAGNLVLERVFGFDTTSRSRLAFPRPKRRFEYLAPEYLGPLAVSKETILLK